MKISIITPSFNQCRYIGQTMNSVLSQAGRFDLEWIVMDGGSTDGTVDLLKGIDDSRVSWVSEPDEGQSHAINKGLSRATGDVLAWLNSDDVYTPGALSHVADAFRDAPERQWLIGRCGIVDQNNRQIRRWISAYKHRRMNRYTFRRSHAASRAVG
jgi:glycosyltransferase involved in cell wall biosynthesis